MEPPGPRVGVSPVTGVPWQGHPVGQVTCPGSHSQWVAKQALNPGSLTRRAKGQTGPPEGPVACPSGMFS